MLDMVSDRNGIVEAQRDGSETPLEWAVYSSQDGAVKLFLEVGIYDPRDGRWGRMYSRVDEDIEALERESMRDHSRLSPCRTILAMLTSWLTNAQTVGIVTISHKSLVKNEIGLDD